MKTTKPLSTFAFCLFTFVFVFTTTFAQEAKQTKSKVEEKVQQRDSRNGTEGITADGDKVRIRGTDDSTILFIEEETNKAASIFFYDINDFFGPTRKLLNADGKLMWGTEEVVTKGTYSIGDFAEGGVVFYVDASGEHGLVCAVENVGSTIRWYAGTNLNIYASASSVGGGYSNTELIVRKQGGTGYAAKICRDLNFGGKIDWYLPSMYELNLMYSNKDIINTTAQANGGQLFKTNIFYWSSTENSNDTAWIKSFFNGIQITIDKDHIFFVRAVRAF